MNVKKENPLQLVRDILEAQHGILLTSDLARYGIPRTYLAALEKAGEVQRLSRGVYSAANTLPDEMFALQATHKAAIFSHETALYLLDLTDRTPLFYSLTVPTGYNASSLKTQGAKVYFVNRGLHPLGSITMKSPYGHDIRTFNLERTVCDILRSRNQVDVQFVNDALKRYIAKDEKNITQLYRYAEQFGIKRVVRQYIEVLL